MLILWVCFHRLTLVYFGGAVKFDIVMMSHVLMTMRKLKLVPIYMINSNFLIIAYPTTRKANGKRHDVDINTIPRILIADVAYFEQVIVMENTIS